MSNVNVVGVSQSVLIENGFNLKDNKVSVIPNICRDRKFPVMTPLRRENYRKEFGFKDNQFVIGFIGRISEEKGLHILFEAYNKISEEIRSSITIAITGSSWFKDAKMSNYHQNLLNQSNGLDINWLGYVNNWELHKVYQSLDVTIVPSTWKEPAGQVVIESQSCGTQVIASNIGGIPEYSSPKELKFEVSNSDDLARAIEKSFIVNSQNKENDIHFRSKWVRAHFDLETITKKWLETYIK